MPPLAPPTLENDLPTGLYSEEEKTQILAQIEAAAGADRMTADTDEFLPRKSGVLFPILVNLAAVVLIVGAWFGANAYFQTRQEGLKLRTDKLFSAESKLLSKVLEDAKAQMDAAAAEINKIQSDLAKAASDRAGLQKSFESRVAAQDKALREELAQALAIEKARLQNTGLGEAEVAKRLQDFEGQKNSEFDARLETYRQQAQAEIDKRAQALTALQTKLQTTVNESEKLRLEVEKQSKEREGALQSQLSTQTVDLETLRREREEMNLYFRQTDAALAQVKAAFEVRDVAKTEASVAALRQVLNRASTSAWDSVRARALAQTVLAEALQAAAVAAEDPQAKAEAAAQLEALRTQLKREQALVALAAAESQRALVTIDGLRDDVDDLVRRLDASTTETFEARIDVQYLSSKLEELERTVAELTPYKTRVDTLTRLFAADYPTALARFTETFGSPEGALAFPGFSASWAELSRQIAGSGDTKVVRQQALNDVLAFTTYLGGRSEKPEATRVATERLARVDDDYKKVVDEIQALAASGNVESKVNTDKFQLYGTVAAVSGTKVVLEPLTKVRPQKGDSLELRRAQGKKETVLGRATVVNASSQKVEVDWAGNATTPLSGDAAFLVLP